jgi:DNA-binding transcriptional LysR family regulator
LHQRKPAASCASGEVDLAVGFMPHLEAGFYQQTLFSQHFVCLASAAHPRVQSRPSKKAFMAEGHIVVTASGTGHSIVAKIFAEQGVDRRVVLRLPSFLGVARIVAQTELLVIVPQLLGDTLASQEPVQLLEPPVKLPAYKVKQHWHERFHSDPANVWLRQTMAQLFSS